MNGRSRGRGQKPKNFKKTIKRLVVYCRREWAMVIFALFCAIAGAILNLQGPGRLSDITDEITAGMQKGINMERLGRMFLILIIIYGCSMVLIYLQGFIMATVTQALSQRMRRHVSEKINKVPMGFFNKISYGDI
jgi:ATP-binding cassette subfamily B multidrug efflux pump